MACSFHMLGVNTQTVRQTGITLNTVCICAWVFGFGLLSVSVSAGFFGFFFKSWECTCNHVAREGRKEGRKKEWREDKKKKTGKEVRMIISLTLELLLCWRHGQVMSPPKAAPPPSSSPERVASWPGVWWLLAAPPPTGRLRSRVTRRMWWLMTSCVLQVERCSVSASDGIGWAQVQLLMCLIIQWTYAAVPWCTAVFEKEETEGEQRCEQRSGKESQTHSGLNTLCVSACTPVSECACATQETRHTSYMQQTVTATRWLPQMAQCASRRQSRRPPATAVGGNRSSLREDESVDGNTLLIRLQRLPLDAIQQKRGGGGYHTVALMRRPRRLNDTRVLGVIRQTHL